LSNIRDASRFNIAYEIANDLHIECHKSHKNHEHEYIEGSIHIKILK